MQREVLWLSTIDIPPAIYGDDLLHLLEEKYPENRVLIEGFLASFSELPIELLQKIFSAHTSVWLLSVQLNNALRGCFLETLYSSICEIPVTRWEIMEQINHGKPVSFVYAEDDDRVRCYRILLSEQSLSVGSEEESSSMGSSHSSMESEEDHEPSFENALRSSPYVIDELWQYDFCDGYACVSPSDIEEVEDRDFEARVEMLSEYALLCRRLQRLGRDPSPAKKLLVDTYNRKIAPDLTGVTPVDCGRFFLASYIASNVISNVGLRTVEFDTRDRAQVVRMFEMFRYCRVIVRDEVVRITGTRIDENTFLVI